MLGGGGFIRQILITMIHQPQMILTTNRHQNLKRWMTILAARGLGIMFRLGVMYEGVR